MADDKKASGMDGLTEVMGEFLQVCEKKGMVLPFILIGASPNGSVLALRVIGDGSDGEVLAEHYEDEGFRVPVTCVVIDQTGEAARATIRAEKVTYH